MTGRLLERTLQAALPRIRHLLRVVCLIVATQFAGAGALYAEAPILDAPSASQRLADGGLVLLDIRSRQEWAETGVATGAWPVSMHEADFAARLQAILTHYKPGQIALICATGGRSSYVTEVLEKNGITGVIDVSEGMMGNGRAPGWIARGLPVSNLDAALKTYQDATRDW